MSLYLQNTGTQFPSNYHTYSLLQHAASLLITQTPRSQLILSPLLPTLQSLTNSRRPHLHPINTLLHLPNPPNLIRLRTRQHHRRHPIRTIPAPHPILKPHIDPFSLTQSLPLSIDLLIHLFLSKTRKVAHVRPTARALAGFLACLHEPAKFVLVLA